MMMKDQNQVAQFQTDRLTCARPDQTDLVDFTKMHKNDDVMATLGGRQWTDEESKTVLNRFIAHWEAHGFGPWIVRESNSGDYVGRGGLRHVIVDSRPEVELLYATMPQFWRLGYTSEAATEMVRIGLDAFDLGSIVAFTLPANEGSQGVMKRAGLRYEKTVDWNGYESVFYRITR